MKILQYFIIICEFCGEHKPLPIESHNRLLDILVRDNIKYFDKGVYFHCVNCSDKVKISSDRRF